MANRKYEAFYIVKPDLTEAEVQKIADRFRDVVLNHGGTVEKAGKWDKRKLAYEVNGFKEGTYILMNFESDPKVPAELRRLLGISDDVIRHRIYLEAKPPKPAKEPKQPKEPKESKDIKEFKV